MEPCWNVEFKFFYTCKRKTVKFDLFTTRHREWIPLLLSDIPLCAPRRSRLRRPYGGQDLSRRSDRAASWDRAHLATSSRQLQLWPLWPVGDPLLPFQVCLNKNLVDKTLSSKIDEKCKSERFSWGELFSCVSLLRVSCQIPWKQELLNLASKELF